MLRVSKLFKPLLGIGFVLEAVMDKLCYSMLTRISVNHSCSASSMEAFKVSVQVQMEFKCLRLQVRDSFIG